MMIVLFIMFLLNFVMGIANMSDGHLFMGTVNLCVSCLCATAFFYTIAKTIGG